MEKYSIFADKRIKKVYTKEELEKMDKDEIRFVAGAKVEKSIHDIFYIDGSLLSIWHCVNRKVDFNVETFGYNMKQYPGVFCFNPYLIMMSTTEFLTYIMVSQGLKLLLRHPTYRILSDKPRHAVASNLAINSLLPANIIAHFGTLLLCLLVIFDENIVFFKRKFGIKPKHFWKNKVFNVLYWINNVSRE